MPQRGGLTRKGFGLSRPKPQTQSQTKPQEKPKTGGRQITLTRRR
jgi:hypothetical protein